MATITIHRPEWISSTGPMLFEVRDEMLRVVERGVLGNQPASASLVHQGRFQVSLFVAGRRQLTAPLNVDQPDGEYHVEFSPPRSTSEPVATRQPSGGTTNSKSGAVPPRGLKYASPPSRGIRGSTPTDVEPPDLSDAVDAPEVRSPSFTQKWLGALGGAFGGVFGSPVVPLPSQTVLVASDQQQQQTSNWCHLWRLTRSGATSRWEKLPWGSAASEIAIEGGVGSRTKVIRLRLSDDQSHVVQHTTGISKKMRNTVLPPGNIIVRLNAKPAAEDQSPLDIDLSNCLAENLVGFLLQGDIDRARALDDAVLAESLVFGKQLDPIAAIVGAYFLLRIGDLERLHDWSRNLATRMQHLPDGPIIHGWFLLQSKSGSADEAREWFIEATRRGMPVFTEGVRLLADGFRLFHDDEAQAAAAVVQRFATAICWTEPYLTYLGQHPAQPGSAAAETSLPSSDDETVLFF